MGKAYDPAYKIEICKQVESGTVTVAEISRETGINENTLYTWMKRYRENRDKPFVGSGRILRKTRKWCGCGEKIRICGRKTRY